MVFLRQMYVFTFILSVSKTLQLNIPIDQIIQAQTKKNRANILLFEEITKATSNEIGRSTLNFITTCKSLHISEFLSEIVLHFMALNLSIYTTLYYVDVFENIVSSFELRIER